MTNVDRLKESFDKLDNAYYKSYANSKKENDKAKKHTYFGNVADEMTGGSRTINALAGIGTGALSGAAIAKLTGTDPYKGASIGALTNVGVNALANLTGHIIALTQAKRTLNEQAAVDADPNRTLYRTMLPGMATYDMQRRPLN